MKRLYFFTICFLPILLSIYLIVSVLMGSFVNTNVYMALSIYFWVGWIVILVDLWRLRISMEKRWMWTLLNIFLSVIALPIYFYVYPKLIQEIPREK